MSEWQNFKLREVGTLQRGRSRHRPRYAFHLFNGPYPFIQTGEVREARKYVSTFENTYSEAGLAQSKLWPKGTLCITIAANIAELAILGFDACFPDSVLGFIPDETRSDLDFVYYTLTHFQKQLKHIGEGSVQDNINLGTFEDIEFPFPSLTEQKAIASVLSSLDDKIDLLHRQNKTLEAMAETLFRQWFIEEAKEDWEGFSVSDIAIHVKDNVNPSKDPLKTFYHFSLPAFDSGQKPTIEVGSDILSNKYRVAENSILISKLNPRVPRVWLLTNAEENYVCSTEFQNLKPKVAPHLMFLYSLFSSRNVIDELTMSASGTSGSHQRVKPEDMLNVTFRTPSLDYLEQYSSLIAPSMQKVASNKQQIQTLENLRDTLLPKLMSGEVRVQYQTEEIA